MEPPARAGSKGAVARLSETLSRDDGANPDGAQQSGPFRRGLQAALGAGGILLLVAVFLPLLHPFWPAASAAEHFALQIAFAALLLGLFALCLKRWRWLIVFLAVAALEIWSIHPYWPSFVRGSFGHPSAAVTPDTLKIVSLNLWVRGDSHDAVRRYLAGSGADVIGLVEATPAWKAALAPLSGLYPYRVDCIGRVPGCQEILLSKHPIRQSGADRLEGALPVLAWAEVQPPGAPPITVAVTHLARPVFTPPADLSRLSHLSPDLPALLQAEQADRLVAALRRLDSASAGDLVLMGDFNAAPWSAVQQALRRATDLDNKGQLALTWPSFLPAALRLPIDHVMTRGRARIEQLGAGPEVGSDHLPLEASISFAQP
jgi:endonuclease/exonuclease/phosphatase (EEP) superfamily protein YafD